MRELLLLVLLLPILAACPGHDAAMAPASSAPAAASIAAPAPAPAPPDEELLANLTFLATATLPPADELHALLERLQRGELTLERYVDSLLENPRFAREIAPRVLLAEWQMNPGSWALPKGYTLKKTQPDPSGKLAYFLREPCSPAEAVKVHPWWDPDAEVLICPDSYQPDHFNQGPHHCDGILLAPGASTGSRYCGCGPDLMRCYPDAEVYGKVSKSLVEEVNTTTEKIVGDDLPLGDLFTRNESSRNRYAEFVYRRWRVENGELASIPDYRTWPEEARWGPRFESSPGEHAGILSTSQVMYREFGVRSMIKNIFDKVWCKEAVSANVQAAAVLQLHAVDLRGGEGWEQLAKRPVCETCHARLDYAMQFNKGFGEARYAAHFIARLVPGGRGPLYGEDSQDYRGEGELTTRGLAGLLVKQHEFGDCMAQDVARHVFNDRASPEDQAAVREAFEKTGRLRPMMKVALLRYAGSYGKHAVAPPLIGTAAASGSERVALSPRARALIEEHCSDCHGDGARELDFRSTALPRLTALNMLSNVAFERMPKTYEGLDHGVRVELVTELIGTLWSDPAERTEALHYYRDRMRALPIHRATLALDLVRERSGASTRGQLKVMETSVRGDQAQLTPGFAAMIGLEAIRGCKASGHTGEALERCLEIATSPDVLVNGMHR